MQAYMRIYHTNTIKIHLEDGSVIDIFDDPNSSTMDAGLYGVANVIQTYGIKTLNVEDYRFADSTVHEYIKAILSENYNYNEDFSIEVVK